MSLRKAIPAMMIFVFLGGCNPIKMLRGTENDGATTAPGTPEQVAENGDQATPAEADTDVGQGQAAPAQKFQVVVTGKPAPAWQAPAQAPCASDTTMVRSDGKWSLELAANTWVTWGVTCDGSVFRDKRTMKPVPGVCFVPDRLPESGAWSEEYAATDACPWRKILITNPGGDNHSGRPSDIASIGRGTFPQDTEEHLKQIAQIALVNEAAIAAAHPQQ